MFSWFRKQREPGPRDETADLAQLLLDECVRKIIVDSAKDRRLDAATTARLEAKTRLYQLAAVWIALKGEERQNPRLLAVRECIEDTVFASSPDGGASLRAALSIAAHNLNDDLLLPKGLGKPGGILWAQAWLREIGVDEWNPVTCDLLAHQWTRYYIALVDTLRAFTQAPDADSREP